GSWPPSAAGNAGWKVRPRPSGRGSCPPPCAPSGATLESFSGPRAPFQISPFIVPLSHGVGEGRGEGYHSHHFFAAAAGAAGAAAAGGAAPGVPPPAAFLSPECPWNVRVGENSPSLCPTMFSL